MIRRHVTIHGDVQGVFFRDTCRSEAWAAEVAGWVRNTSSGAVEAAFEGQPDAVERLVEWCRHGPAGARVERVDVDEEEPHGEHGFVVRSAS